MAKKIRHGEMPSMPEATPKSIKDLVAKCWVVDFQKRTNMDECYRFLSGYLDSHSNEFPPIEKMAVNKIPGVKRTFAFVDDPPELREIQITAKVPT